MTAGRGGAYRLAFLLGVPLAWAVLLLFHAGHDPADVYGGLSGQSGRWLVVHVGTLVFIGLMAAALVVLLRGLEGMAARVARVAAGAFALFYGASEAILGIATGVLVRHADAVPEADRAAAAAAVQALWDDPLSDDLATGAGIIAWVVAIVAAAVALRRAGAPLPAVVLLGLSAAVVLHAPPIGPLALVCFAAAAALLPARPR
jgi:hypothetical protein